MQQVGSTTPTATLYRTSSTVAAYHDDGSAWTPEPTGTTTFLGAVWADAPDDAWAVGGSGTVLHWDGRSWSP